MPDDVFSLLQDDHRHLQRRFEQFQSARSLPEEEELAFDIIAAMRTHLDLGRTIVYPALTSGSDGYTVRQCLADHEQIDQLLDEIEHAGATEDAFFAKVHVLCELFSQHVRDEEKPRGVFEQARHSSVDLAELAIALERRRASLGRSSAPA